MLDWLLKPRPCRLRRPPPRPGRFPLLTGEVTDEEVLRAIRALPLRLAFSDATGLQAGTNMVWNSAGGSGGGGTITCTSLAAAALRQGTKSTTSLSVAPPNSLASATMPEILEVRFECQHTTAPTAGGTDELYFGFSDSSTAGTDNPAGLSGTDATGPNVDTLGQLTFCGAIVVSNNIGTGVQRAYFLVRPLDAWFSPVVYNNASTAFDATAAHTVITVTPWYRERST